MISDGNYQVSLITDIPEAITTDEDGSMEIILHRNSMQTQGNGETMQDKSTVKINHLISIESTTPKKINSLEHRKKSLLHNFPPLVVLKDKSSLFSPPDNLLFQKQSFEPHLHLVSLQLFDQPNNILSFRFLNHLQNSLETDLNQHLFSPVVIPFSSLFSSGDCRSFGFFEETTLTFNQNLQKCKRDVLNSLHPAKKVEKYKPINGVFEEVKDQDLTLSSMDIRSFIVHLNEHN